MTLPYDTFVFSGCELEGRAARLRYRLMGNGQARSFEERFELPAGVEESGADEGDVAAALAGLHLIAGVSYWKTCCPARIEVEGAGLTAADAAFWSEVYNRGLGEMYYRNGLDPAGSASFPGDARAPVRRGMGVRQGTAGAQRGALNGPQPKRDTGPSAAEALPAQGKIAAAPEAALPAQGGVAAAPEEALSAAGPPLVLAGGGKDSVVAWEIVRAAGERGGAPPVEGGPVPLSVVPAGRDWRLAPDLEGRGLRVIRRLDPGLFELNAAGAYNGHVPFSAILAFASQLVAVLGGFGAVVAANERSASAGNLTAGGVEVNHQWSKGLRFEEMFQQWQRRHLRRAPVYFSLLRPLGELRIAQVFAEFPRWFGAVTSCNANFRQSGEVASRWCGRCAKCVFAATVLTPWLDAGGIAAVFGASPLADPENVPVLRQLLGLADQKPWDCVGTPGETAAALWLAVRRHGGAELPALGWFEEAVASGQVEASEQQVAGELAPSPVHRLPSQWHDELLRFLAARPPAP
jgi:hypothetical protein